MEQVEEFNIENSNWKDYQDCFIQYFIANDIVNPEKQCAVFLSCVSASGYGLVMETVSAD